MSVNKITNNELATKELAKKLASSLNMGSVITLEGEMGAGKTTFVQGFGEYFKITRMTSPTYTLIKEYPIATKNSKLQNINHIDLYRLSSKDEAESIGIKEIIDDNKAITLIEWPEKIKSLLPKKYISVTIKKLKENQRQIIINNSELVF